MPFTKEQIEWICQTVREWRDAPIDDELRMEQRNNHATEERKHKYHKEIDRRKALPEVVCTMLSTWHNNFQVAFDNRVVEARSELEFLHVVAAGAYGPPSLPTQETLAEIGRKVPHEIEDTERRLEVILVWSQLLPRPSSKSGEADAWEHEWPRGRQALTQMVKKVISNPLAWINRMVLPPRINGDDDRNDPSPLAVILVDALLGMCDCHKAFEDYRIEHWARALYSCTFRHTIFGWNGRTPLYQALAKASINGFFRRDPNLQVSANDFRRAPLPKLVEPSLAAGQVLRCKTEVRNGDGTRFCNQHINANDECSFEVVETNHQTTSPKKTDWWIWIRGTFRIRTCRRCPECEHLFFQVTAANCPNPRCNSPKYSKGTLTTAWSFVGADGALPPDIAVAPSNLYLRNTEQNAAIDESDDLRLEEFETQVRTIEGRDKYIHEIDTWGDKKLMELAKVLLDLAYPGPHDTFKISLGQLARRWGMRHSSFEFRKLLINVSLRLSRRISCKDLPEAAALILGGANDRPEGLFCATSQYLKLTPVVIETINQMAEKWSRPAFLDCPIIEEAQGGAQL